MLRSRPAEAHTGHPWWLRQPGLRFRKAIRALRCRMRPGHDSVSFRSANLLMAFLWPLIGCASGAHVLGTSAGQQLRNEGCATNPARCDPLPEFCDLHPERCFGPMPDQREPPISEHAGPPPNLSRCLMLAKRVGKCCADSADPLRIRSSRLDAGALSSWAYLPAVDGASGTTVSRDEREAWEAKEWIVPASGGRSGPCFRHSGGGADPEGGGR